MRPVLIPALALPLACALAACGDSAKLVTPRGHRPAAGPARACQARDPHGQHRARDGLARRRRADAGRGAGRHRLRARPRPSALAVRAAERRRAGRRDQRAAAAGGRQGPQGQGDEGGDEARRRRRAERQPHHAAARCRRRRCRRTAHRVPRRTSCRRSAWRWSAIRSMSPTPMRWCGFRIARARRRSRRRRSRSPTCRAARSTITGPRAWSPAPTARACMSASVPTATSPRTASTAEDKRAAVLEVDPPAGATRVYASGLRNPVGLAWQPRSGVLWAVVNERDELGSDLVPDYLTSVREGGVLRLALQLLRPARRHAARSRHVPTWWRRPSRRTTRWARTSRRWAWRSTPRPAGPRRMQTAPSSACTVPGTASRSMATRSSSCRSSTASRRVRWRTC